MGDEAHNEGARGPQTLQEDGQENGIAEEKTDNEGCLI